MYSFNNTTLLAKESEAFLNILNPSPYFVVLLYIIERNNNLCVQIFLSSLLHAKLQNHIRIFKSTI